MPSSHDAAVTQHKTLGVLHLFRYAILTRETWPMWRGDPRQGIQLIMNAGHMDDDQYQLGKTKVFIKAPESVSEREGTVLFCNEL